MQMGWSIAGFLPSPPSLFPCHTTPFYDHAVFALHCCFPLPTSAFLLFPPLATTHIRISLPPSSVLQYVTLCSATRPPSRQGGKKWWAKKLWCCNTCPQIQNCGRQPRLVSAAAGRSRARAAVLVAGYQEHRLSTIFKPELSVHELQAAYASACRHEGAFIHDIRKFFRSLYPLSSLICRLCLPCLPPPADVIYESPFLLHRLCAAPRRRLIKIHPLQTCMHRRLPRSAKPKRYRRRRPQSTQTE